MIKKVLSFKVLLFVTFTIILLLTILGQVLMQGFLRQQTNDIAFINHSDDQLKLSQAIAKNAVLIYTHANEPSEIDANSQELQNSLNQFISNQQALLRMFEGEQHDPEDPLQNAFDQIEEPFHQIQESGLLLLQQQQTSSIRMHAGNILRFEPEYVKVMETISQELHSIAAHHSRKITIYQTVWALLIVLVPLTFIFYVYKKAFKRLSESYASLSQLNKALSASSLKQQEGEHKLRTNFKALQDLQSAYAESVDKYRLISTHATDLIMLLSAELICEYVSPSIKEMTGYEAESLLGLSIFHLFTPEEIQGSDGTPIDLFNSMHKTCHVQVKRKDGIKIWLEVSFRTFQEAEKKQLLISARNITKRKKLELLLREVQHLAKVGGWEYDLQTGMVYGTEEVAKIFEIESTEVISFEQALGYFSKSSRNLIRRELNQALEYRKSWDLELSMTTSKGKKRWVRSEGRPYMENGKAHKLSGTLQDITEKIHFEELILRKQNELRAFVENAPVSIAMVDKNMCYKAASAKWFKSFNLDHRNVIGESHYTLFPDIPESWKAVHQRCLNGAVEKHEEDRYDKADGTVQWIKWENRPWYDIDESIGGLIMLSEIVTEKKLADEALLRQQKRMRSFYKIASNVKVNLSSLISQVLITAKASLETDTALLLKFDDNRLVVTDSKSEKIDIKQNAMLDDEHFICWLPFEQESLYEIQQCDSYNGETTRIFGRNVASFIGVPIWVRGQKYGVLCFLTLDVVKSTPFRQADKDYVQLIGQWIGAALERTYFEQELILAKEEAEMGSKAKAQFLSTMSHEIRTPMNAVVGLSHLLLEENPNEDQVQSLKALNFSANHLLALINDILDYSKIEVGKIEFESIPFNLPELIEGVIGILQLKANEKAIALKVSIQSHIPTILTGDPVRLNQILTNLLGNAIKFTEKGTVNIEVNCDSYSDDRYTITFVVRDSGIGIPADKLDLIFNSFSQASTTTTRRYGGTGLGLAITKKLVEQQHGSIEVRSELGKGSEFAFTLSFDKASESELVKNAGTSIPQSQPIKGVKVLVVEDNQVNQFVVRRFLEKWDIHVDIAENGQEAVVMTQPDYYDVILMDLQMPDMDGYQATKIIKQKPEQYFQRVPIIALTASLLSEVKDKIEDAGMVDCISKPFNPSELYSKIFKYALSNKGNNKSDAIVYKEKGELPAFPEIFKAAGNEMVHYQELVQMVCLNYKDFLSLLEKDISFQEGEYHAHKLKTAIKLCKAENLQADLDIFLKALKVNDVKTAEDLKSHLKDQTIVLIEGLENECSDNLLV